MDELAELIGESRVVAVVRERLARLLDHPRGGERLPSVLIQGATGTGKGLVARLLHRHGARASGSFVDVNCAAIPDTLLEAELFGFERGAFTDARRAKPGLFQAADGGVLFLDEVSLLPHSLQPKLLTAIEERAVRRLGSTRAEPANAWIISATNGNLLGAIRAQRFREDLYHRLAVLTLELPPLRDRGRDILLLARRFLARACAEYGLPSKDLDTGAEARLLGYAWPGNIRELANVIERVALFSDTPVVTADALGPLQAASASKAAAGSPSGAVMSRDEATREHLLMALEESGWNVSHTAARLGIARNTVYAHIEKFGLHADPLRKTSLRRPRAAEPALAPPATDTRLQWERRSIALLSVALSGSEGVDARSQASRALEGVIAKVQSFGGRVEDVTPTGLVAAFGLDPVEDAPRRATHAAMAIQTAAQRARERNEGVPGIRIGLHVSPLVIGLVGPRIEIDADAKRAQWQALDQLLQRIEPGGTAASAAAAPFLERRFELAPLGAADEGLGQAYRLTGQERRGLGLWGVTTRFVGRRDELEALWNCLSSALSGRGQVVAVVGEPGVGKSRLFYEFSRSPRVQGWLVLESAAVSYGKAMSYLPVVDLLKAYFKIQDRDDPREVREKVTGKLLALDETMKPSLPALLGLLDVPVDDAAWRALDPVQRRQRTLDAVKRLLLREAREQPLLLVFEDLHWIDGETQALLDGLVDSLGSTRLLLLMNYRPEYRDPWGGKTAYSRLRLDALPAESTGEMLEALLGEDPGLAPLKQLLIKRGNPFFLEETIRALVETKALAGERGRYRPMKPVEALQVPPTVDAILAARIDRLPSEDRHLLQVASVVGKEVPFALLQAIAELSDEALRRGLDRLQAAEFLHEVGLSPDVEYTFKHALTHEVAYGGVLQDRRLALHARIAGAIERLYAGRLTEHVERLAHHSLEGELWDPAMRYLRQAGTKAAERYALREAIAWFGRALNALTHLSESRPTLEQAVDIRIERGYVLAILGDYRVVQENLSEAERLAEQLGDERRRGHVYRSKVNVHNHLGQVDEAVSWGARALEIAERLGDLPLRRYTTTMLEQTHYMRGEYECAIDLAQANLSTLPAEAVYAWPGGIIPTSVYDRGWLVRCLAELGRFAEAAAPAEAAIQIAERTQHPYAIGWACLCAGNLHIWKGTWHTARSLYEHTIGVFREAGVVTSVANVTATSAWALACLGDPEALARAQEGERLLELAREQQRISGNSWSYVWLSQCYLRLGRLEDAERVVGRVLEPRTPSSEAYACHLRGEIAAHPERWQPGTAADCYRSALALAEGCGMRPLIALCHLGLGKLYRRAGQPERTREHLGTATTMCREMGMTYWLEIADKEFADASR